MTTVGPIRITGNTLNEMLSVPLATYETPLWPSVQRGAKLSQLTCGIAVTVIDECMTRSIAIEAHSAGQALAFWKNLQTKMADLKKVTQKTSRFAKLIEVQPQFVGRIIYLRCSFTTGDAAGHNMVTKAAEAIMQWILKKYSGLRYISLSGNFCTDKKVSSVNNILGRGKHVIAEMEISREICEKHLHSTVEKLVEINVKKNLLGSIAAGSLHSANAHFANMLLAFYLATGQDGANIIEGSQGITYCEVTEKGLYFSVSIPNLIIGTVGNGKDLTFVQKNLKNLGCLARRKPGENARRLAAIAAATVLCGELSLLAALTRPTELMRTHVLLERKTNGKKT